MTFKELLLRCGGSLNLARKLRLRQSSVEAWGKRLGPPVNYWHRITRMANPPITYKELHDLNMAIRKQRERRGQKGDGTNRNG